MIKKMAFLLERPLAQASLSSLFQDSLVRSPPALCPSAKYT